MNTGEKTIAIVVPITVAIIGGVFTLITADNSGPIPNNEGVNIPTSEPPTAIISGPKTISAKTLATFTTDKSEDPDGYIDNYQWYVNGEKINEQSFLEHYFETKGTYQIDLVVFDDDKLSGKDTMTVQVLEPLPPTNSREIGDYENPEDTTFSINSDENVTIIGKFRNYGTIDNQGTLRILGWNTNTNGTLINLGSINNHGIIKFEHGGFDNHGNVKNYETLVTDFRFNNRDMFENFGTVELSKGSMFLNTGSFENSGIMTVECMTLVSGNNVEGNSISDNCVNPSS